MRGQDVNNPKFGSVGSKTADELPSEGGAPTVPMVGGSASRVGRYQILEKIGMGGMGIVFAAYDERLDRKVALKVLQSRHVDWVQNQVFREARAAARVSHPNVVPIYEVNRANGIIHLSMEFVDGPTLSRWQTEPGRTWRDKIAMYLQAGRGLEAAHAANVIHLDFKPENVLIGKDGRPRVVDFGLASVATVDAQEDSPSAEPKQAAHLRKIAGTPGYMSPEQCRGEAVSHRSDQWSFCAALYQALYGHLPYDGRMVLDFSENLRKNALRPPPSDTVVPEEIKGVLLRGLQLDPEQRFLSMTELLSALEREHQEDIDSGGIARKRFTVLFFVVATSLLVLFLIRRWDRPITHREAIGTSIVVLLVALLGGAWRRRTLLAHKVHGHAWLVIFAVLVQNFFLRVLATVQGIPMAQMAPFEMVVFAGTFTLGLLIVIKRFRLLGLLPLIYACISVTGILPPRLGVIIYVTTMVLFLYAWNLAASDCESRLPRSSFAPTSQEPSHSSQPVVSSGQRVPTPQLQSSYEETMTNPGVRKERSKRPD